MTDLLQNISSIVWLALAIVFYVRLRRWNKRFETLYDELREKIEREFDNG